MDVEGLKEKLHVLNIDKRYLEDLISKSQASLNEVQKEIKFLNDILNPNVSLSEIKLKDKDYYVIKGSYQVIDKYGKKVRLSVFVGRKDEFPDGKNDERAVKIAIDKMKILLQNKF
jgi:hypothetical protein